MSISLVLPSPVWAWSGEGHELVGAVADRFVRGTAAQKKIDRLLQGRSLAQVAGWADCLKGVSPEAGFEYINPGRYPECKIFENPEDIAVMVAFVKRNHDSCFASTTARESCHKHYHFTDLSPSQESYRQQGFGSAEEDIVHALNACINYLRGNKVEQPFNFANETEALLMLIHLVGDIHQPLHVGAVYLDDEGKVKTDVAQAARQFGAVKGSSLGGNALQFEQTNLHSMWDKVSPAVKDAVQQAMSRQQDKTLSLLSGEQFDMLAEQWANESLGLARQAFADLRFGKRSETPRGDRWNVELPGDYRDRVERIQSEQILKSGQRLAIILQSIYRE